MPTYEYECSNCNLAWEHEQRITEPATTQCPACCKDTAHRVISRGTGFSLKGGGWAADNYGSTKAR